jgi:hypothetical protein
LKIEIHETGGEMKKLLFIALLMTAFLHGAEAQGADWKYYGAGTLQKSENVMTYYDAGSIEHLSDGHVKAWTKCISRSDVERTINLEEVTKRAERKIEAGYIAPYILSNPKSQPNYDVNMRTTVWEEAANEDVIKPKLKVFYELNCKAKRIRNLSVISYKNDGGTETRSETDRWISIGPESNSETLYKMLCKQRDMIK